MYGSQTGSEAAAEKADEAAAAAAAAELAELRLRVLHGVKRYFRSTRLSGLLSPEGLRVAT